MDRPSLINERVIERRCLLTTGRFNVERRTYAQTGKSPIEKDVVVHPGAVVILPILDAERIVMIRNVRRAAEAELWELPAGTREPGESAGDTAHRELEEETGYRAALMEPFLEFYTSPGVMTERMVAFVAKNLTWVGQSTQDGERITVEVTELHEARARFLAGDFCDGKTIAVLGTYFARTGWR